MSDSMLLTGLLCFLLLFITVVALKGPKPEERADVRAGFVCGIIAGAILFALLLTIT